MSIHKVFAVPPVLPARSHTHTHTFVKYTNMRIPSLWLGMFFGTLRHSLHLNLCCLLTVFCITEYTICLHDTHIWAKERVFVRWKRAFEWRRPSCTQICPKFFCFHNKHLRRQQTLESNKKVDGDDARCVCECPT